MRFLRNPWKVCWDKESRLSPMSNTEWPVGLRSKLVVDPLTLSLPSSNPSMYSLPRSPSRLHVNATCIHLFRWICLTEGKKIINVNVDSWNTEYNFSQPFKVEQFLQTMKSVHIKQKKYSLVSEFDFIFSLFFPYWPFFYTFLATVKSSKRVRF